VLRRGTARDAGGDPRERRLGRAAPPRGDPAECFRALGWTVQNPVEIGEAAFGKGAANIPSAEYLRADVRAICDCTAIALLPGWEQSTGARAEVAVAVTIGLDFYDAGTMHRIDAPARVVICGGYERPAGAVDTLDTIDTVEVPS
jgi:hypothetical protein